MITKDAMGKYELKVDTNRRIVYEKLIGLWSVDDFKRFDNDYRTKIVKQLGAGNWAKSSDMREYKPNTHVTPEMMDSHLKFVSSTGCIGGACIIDSITLKMQLKRASKESIGAPGYFDNEQEADSWLKDKGF